MDNKIPLLQYDGHINTYSGRKINLLDPSPKQISIHDIARGLSFNSHFGGQTPEFFSIAQHCLLVCELMPPRYQQNPKIMMLALLHDASEAYLGDMLKPLKVMLPEFQKIENNMMDVILHKYDLDPVDMKIIKPFDRQAQELEYEAFYKKGRMRYDTPEQSKSHFMRKYYIYMNLRQMETESVSDNFLDNQ